MANTEQSDTPAAVIAPGSTTSEFQLTKYVTLVGGVLTVIFSTLSQVQMSGLLPEQGKVAQVIAGVLAVVSMLLTLAKALGYTNSRRDLKLAGLQADADVRVAQATAPTRQVAATPEAVAAADEVNRQLGGK